MSVFCCLLIAGLGQFLQRVNPMTPTGSISPWTGTALTPSSVRFTCEQTGERNEKPVLASIDRFRARVKAYWVQPIGASRNEKNGRYGFYAAADVEHRVWLPAEPPLTNGETRVFTLPDDRRVSFTYRVEVPSPLFKIDQLGYAPEAGEKYAYVGAWLGLAGEWKAQDGGPKSFSLVDDASGKAVFSGVPKLCRKDSYLPEGTPWTGERPYELDFSEVTAPGRYHLEIEGLGRSDSFRIGMEPLMDAFNVHMTGMKRQHCGIDCHQTVYLGDFPPYDWHYGVDKVGGRKYGFFNKKGESIFVDRFRLIYDNVERWKKNGKVRAPGGWHDAADYDRRPQHLRAVCDLAGLALVKPACTGAVEEAYWGLRHLLAMQEPDGGIRSWLETYTHPGAGESPQTEDKRDLYFASMVTRESTLEYAAHAAMTALAMSEEDPRRKQLTDSAIRAWNYALTHPQTEKELFYAGEMIIYRGEPELPGDMLLKAGLDLSLLTGNDDYLKPILKDIDRIVACSKGQWWWSPFRLIELDVNERMLEPDLRPCYKAYRSWVIFEADTMLDQLAHSWAYRTPWYPATSFHARNQGWGFGLPLLRARMLVVAHAITWKQKYLDGAYLANNFHNGCNPDGETYTSGLGIRPVRRYLDLEGKYSAGVTPYRLIGGSLEWVRLNLCFPDGIWKAWPVWRRFHNLEVMTVRNSEFTVWETIAPAAAVTGYLAY